MMNTDHEEGHWIPALRKEQPPPHGVQEARRPHWGILTWEEEGLEVARPAGVLHELCKGSIAYGRCCEAHALDPGRRPLGQVAEQPQGRELGHGPSQGVSAQHQPAPGGRCELV